MTDKNRTATQLRDALHMGRLYTLGLYPRRVRLKYRVIDTSINVVILGLFAIFLEAYKVGVYCCALLIILAIWSDAVDEKRIRLLDYGDKGKQFYENLAERDKK